MSHSTYTSLDSLLAHYTALPRVKGMPPASNQAITDLEEQFKKYLIPPKTKKKKAARISTTPSALITTLITTCQQLERNRVLQLEETISHYPKGGLLLTQALRFLITTHGLTGNYALKERAIALLTDPRILDLIYNNDQQLIYQINEGVKERKKKDETEAAELKLEQELSAPYQPKKNNPISVNQAAGSLSSFLYYVEHPSEDEVMERALGDLLKNFGGFVRAYEEDEVDVIRKVYRHSIQKNKNKWYFLDAVYSHYRKKGPLAVENLINDLEVKKEKYAKGKVQIPSIDKLVSELKLVSETHVKMSRKTKNQAIGMMIGGFAFGMEIGMLFLENLALMSTLGPWWVLGFSLGACAILGTGIALYFHSAHYDELEKHNRFAYFHRKNNQNSESETQGYGTFIAKLGTIEEGVAAACLLATLGAFMVFDMISWGIAGGNYTSALPGLFFATVSPHIVLTVVAGLALFSACAWVASCLASAHYALDGKHTIEYYNKKTEEKEMKQIIAQETQEPLVFNWKSRFNHRYQQFTDGLQATPSPRFALR